MGCLNSAVISAPVDAVWAKLRDFHELSWAAGVIESTEVVGDLGGTTVGAKRVLNGTFHETLVALDDRDRVIRYTIDDGPGTPVAKDNVTDYVGEVRVFPVTKGDATYVLWTSTWGTSQGGGVAEFCNPIYQALLGALDASFSS